MPKPTAEFIASLAASLAIREPKLDLEDGDNQEYLTSVALDLYMEAEVAIESYKESEEK
jgi:hypothetical protein